MAIDVSTLTDYSFAEIAKAAKSAMVSALVGGSTLAIAGRTIGRVTPKEAADIYRWATEMDSITSSSSSPSGVAVASFRDGTI